MLLAGRYFIPESEFEWEFVQSAGPGGQNVNTVETGVRVIYLPALLEGALKVPKLRKPTRPTAGSVRRRLAAKERRSMLKRSRSYRPGEEE